ncbi:hypothetical protein [Streptomyces microflavus]|uniref:hypothetical protein n=1 Tax=Streptomyces microflavus TaxID=1919 RepID=UPI0036300004
MQSENKWFERLDTAERILSRCNANPDNYGAEDIAFLEQYVTDITIRINQKDEEYYD